jgi:hypothetical protein
VEVFKVASDKEDPEKLVDGMTPDNRDDHRLQIILAIIGAGATIMAALIAGLPALLSNRAVPSPESAVAPDPIEFSVDIDGPVAAPLGQPTYFIITSEQASRVEWAIAGFGNDEIIPFRQTDQIFVSPSDPNRVGEWFTLVVTAFNPDGETAGARHRFQITAAVD